jgi:hypothetical protein
VRQKEVTDKVERVRLCRSVSLFKGPTKSNAFDFVGLYYNVSRWMFYFILYKICIYIQKFSNSKVELTLIGCSGVVQNATCDVVDITCDPIDLQVMRLM